MHQLRAHLRNRTDYQTPRNSAEGQRDSHNWIVEPRHATNQCRWDEGERFGRRPWSLIFTLPIIWLGYDRKRVQRQYNR